MLIKYRNKWRFFLFLFFLLSPGFLPVVAYAWPTTSQWIPVYKNSAFLQDPSGDANGARNVVADPTHDAAFLFNDGTYLYFRLRLDQDPTGQGGQGALQSFGWGVELDTNQNPADYEWLFMVDGISRTEVITLGENTAQGTLGDPSDKPEIVQSTLLLAGNFQVSPADTSINGDLDYFLDWRFPYVTFKQVSGLTDTSPIRLFFGSSSSAMNLTSAGSDLVGGSDLYSGFTDVTTLLGTIPTTGSVKFVSDLAGNGDVIQIIAGDTLYLRVIDNDMNYNNATLQTVTVKFIATSGDTSLLTLTETDLNSGIFTASIPTQSGSPIAGDGILQVTPGATVSVEYIDGIDASYVLNQIRTDSVYVISLLPAISLIKSADPLSAPPGADILYTIHFHNSGVGAATNLIISDTIPLFTTYVTGSLKIGSAASNYTTATTLTDGVDSDSGRFIGAGVVFTVSNVSGDDGLPNAGSDEGKVYFKVRIN